MAIAKVQQVGGGSTTNGQTTTGAVGGTFSATNLLVACVAWSYSGVGASGTISLPAGWTDSGAATVNNTAPNCCARAFYLPNNAGGAQTWTWNLTMNGGGTALEWTWTIIEFSGAATTSPLDLAVASNNNGGTATVTVDTLAASGTTASADLLVQVAGTTKSTSPTYTASASSVPTGGWTVGTVYNTSAGTSPYSHMASMWQILAGTQASPRGILTASATVSFATFLMTFKVAASGTTLTPGSQALAITFQKPILDNNVVPAAQAVTITMQTPSLGFGIIPGSQALAISLQTPTLAVNSPLVPADQALVISLQVPTLTNAGGTTLTPGSQSLAIALQAPFLGIGLFPASQSLGVTLRTPSLGFTLVPSAQALTLALQLASLGYTLPPASLALILSMWLPVVTVAGASVAGHLVISEARTLIGMTADARGTSAASESAMGHLASDGRMGNNTQAQTVPLIGTASDTII